MARLNDTEAIVRRGLRGDGLPIQSINNGATTRTARYNPECSVNGLFGVLNGERPRDTNAGSENLREGVDHCE